MLVVSCWWEREEPPSQSSPSGGRGGVTLTPYRVRGRVFVGITMALRGPHKGMKIASSLGMVEADPAPGPSSGTPQDDMTGWPGPIFIAMTLRQAQANVGMGSRLLGND